VAILDDTFQDLVIDFSALISLDHAGLTITYQYILDSAINPPQLTHFIISDEARDLWICCFFEVSPQPHPELTSLEDIEQVALHLTQDIENMSMTTFET
jgi:hypothetical protein